MTTRKTDRTNDPTIDEVPEQPRPRHCPFAVGDELVVTIDEHTSRARVTTVAEHGRTIELDISGVFVSVNQVAHNVWKEALSDATVSLIPASFKP